MLWLEWRAGGEGPGDGALPLTCALGGCPSASPSAYPLTSSPLLQLMAPTLWVGSIPLGLSFPICNRGGQGH